MNRVFWSSAAALMVAGAACGQEANGENGTIPLVGERLPVVEVVGLRSASEDDITGSYSALSEEDLLIRNAPNVVDQLRALPGVGVSSSGGPGALTQVRMRGAEANHTLVLLDGIEVSDPTTGETDFGLLTGIPASRIEVLRGEQSAIYGSDAIGGVVALQTSRDERVGGLLEAGSLDTARGEISGIAEIGEGYVGGNLTGFTTRGVDTAGLNGEKDGSSAYGGSVFGGTEFSNNWELSGFALYRASEVDIDPDTDFDGRLDNADRETESGQFVLGASLIGETGPVDHIFRASYNSVTRENRADGQFADETKGERTKVSWSPSVEFANAHTFSGLIDLESEDYERVGAASFFGDPNQSQSFDTLGFAGEYRYRWDSLSLSASARQDLNDDRFNDTTTWRLGAAYNFDFDGRIRASVGTGVKNPTFTELFGFFPGSFIGNSDLKPEQSLGWEIGWDQSIRDVTVSATFFEAELEDEIVTRFTPTFAATPANLDGISERSGWEFAAGWQVADTLMINAAVSLIDSQNDSGVDEIRVPSETASLSFDWRSEDIEDLRVGLAFDYVGEQLDTDFSSFQTVALDPYTLVSATAEFPLSPRVSFTLRGDNLLDEDAVDVICFNTPGRGLYFGFKLR